MVQRPSLSAVLITFNAAEPLSKCLASLGFVDEILVVDSGSSDATLDVARRYGARTMHREWLGFGRQKQYAVEQAANDWVLCVDSDEAVPAGLASEILGRIGSEGPWAFEVPRANFFLGRYLKHGEGYPDWSLRLFHRQHARWSADVVHEKVVTSAPVIRIRGAGALLHHSAESLASYLEKQNRYTTLQAESLFAAGRNAGLGRMVLSPLLRFFKFYFLRAGFLDGVAGLVHVAIGCFNSFIKYAKLRALREGRP